jgi:hypothetical protein
MMLKKTILQHFVLRGRVEEALRHKCSISFESDVSVRASSAPLSRVAAVRVHSATRARDVHRQQSDEAAQASLRPRSRTSDRNASLPTRFMSSPWPAIPYDERPKQQRDDQRFDHPKKNRRRESAGQVSCEIP